MDFNNFFDLNKPEDQFRLAANCFILFLSIIAYIKTRRMKKSIKHSEALLEIFKKLEEKSIRKE
jgi:hypothetical protein